MMEIVIPALQTFALVGGTALVAFGIVFWIIKGVDLD